MKNFLRQRLIRPQSIQDLQWIALNLLPTASINYKSDRKFPSISQAEVKTHTLIKRRVSLKDVKDRSEHVQT